jgi:micrococcal nuclease
MKRILFATALLVLVTLACGSEEQVPTVAPTAEEIVAEAPATDTLEPTEEPSNTSEPTDTAIPPYPPGELAQVTQVIDGDTIDVDMDGTTYRVRYIGMDTPEQGAPFFQEATGANAELVDGKEVVLVKDVSETDQYGRLLRYVYLPDGTCVNSELVRLGFAQIATYPPDVAHEAEFLALQQEARDTGLGLWGLPTNTPIPLPTNTPVPLPTNTPIPLPTNTPIPLPTNTPIPLPTNTPIPLPTNTLPPPPPPQQNCDPHYPTVCIPPYPPDLDCGEISYRRFQVLQPDPHGFDRDKDGIGCESG